MWRALAAIGEQIPDDVRVVVVRGSGQSFSAGLDRAMLDPAGAGDGVETVAGLLALPDEEIVGGRSTRSSAASPGCATRGSSRSRSCRATRSAPASSWRCPATCGCVADDAQFCMKESALGLVPDLTGTKPLVETVGYARALEICATARMVVGRGGGGDRAGQRRRPGRPSSTPPSPTWSAALTAPLPGAVRETKALLLARVRPRRSTSSGGSSARRRYAGSASSPPCWPAEAQSRIPRLASSTVRRSPCAEDPVEPRRWRQPPQHLGRLPGGRPGPGGCRTRRTRRRRGRRAGRRWRRRRC